jgi:hypothetical protein
MRERPRVASARTLPLLIAPIAAIELVAAIWISFPMTAMSDGALPLYGTNSNRAPDSCAKRSMPRWTVLPTPEAPE